MNKKLLIFDFDGVIADSMDLVLMFYRTVAEKYGFNNDFKKEDLQELFKQNIYEAIKGLGLSESTLSEMRKDMDQLSIDNKDKYKLFEGIEDVLRNLAQNHTLAIISSNMAETINFLLNKHNIKDLFAVVHGAEEKHSKVEKINHVVEELSADKNATYYIGDTIGDINEGKEAGVHTVAVAWGYHDKIDLETSNPEYLFNNIKDLRIL